MFGVRIGLMSQKCFTFISSAFSDFDFHNQPWWWCDRFATNFCCCCCVFRPRPQYCCFWGCWGWYDCSCLCRLVNYWWHCITNCVLMMLLAIIHPIPLPVPYGSDLCYDTMLAPWLACMCALSCGMLGIWYALSANGNALPGWSTSYSHVKQ